MRLHHLEVTAFGPFADTVEVDLDALGACGLFLINGPTGSGKTSLLDAVCFALYADVPGSRPRGALRSDHAAPDAVPTVELEWSVGARRFRIVRSPEFHRPKKRGTGTTKQQHKVVMTELVDGGWVDRGSGRADEVGTIVRDVLGLDLRQFATIVLLPQGEFARFLSAGTDVRAAILQRLFDTGRFDQVKAWLEARRRDAEEQVRDARVRLSSGIQRLDDAAAQAVSVAPEGYVTAPLGDEAPEDEAPADPSGQLLLVPAPDAPAEEATGGERAEAGTSHAGVPLQALLLDPDDEDPERVRAAARTLLAEVDRLAELLSRASDEREEELRAAAEADEIGRRRAQGRGRAKEATESLATLEARAQDVDQQRAQLAAARAAAEVLPLVEADDRRSTALEQARQARQAAQAALPEPLRRRAPDDRDRPDAAVAQALDEAHELAQRLGEQVRRAASAQDQARSAAAGVEQRLAAVTAAQQSYDTAAAAHDELAARRAVLQPLAADEPAARTRLRRLEGAASRREALTRQDAALARAQEGVDLAVAARETAQAELADLHRRRAAGLAAELATSLVSGDPCPVCGSPEHPAPAAHAEGTLVSPEEVEDAEERLGRRRDDETQALALLEGTRARRQGEADELTAALAEAGDVDPARLDDEIAAARQDHQSAEQAVADLATCDLALQESTTSLDGLAAQVTRATEGLADARARVDTARSRTVSERADAWRLADELAAVAELDLPAPLPDAEHARQEVPPPDLLGPLTEAAATARSAWRRLTEAWVAADLAGTEREQAAAALAAALGDSGLADAAAVRAAALPSARRTALEQQILAHDRAVEQARTVLADPGVVEALAAHVPDLPALADALHAARTAARTATERAAVVQQARQQLRRHRETVEQTLDDLGPRLEQAAVVREVADTVAGTGPNNVRHMSLPTYVLAARLEEVARLANERLARMTDGRYELRHSDALAAHGARSGLGLEVVDAWSGKARDTATLSGGETFMASLALALGLGDAVRAESGGVDLDTLFVDEGFGTLDETALEQVMEVLDGLREGGRSVGIISHVAELRQRIPAQVRLSRGRRGSTLEVVTQPEVV